MLVRAFVLGLVLLGSNMEAQAQDSPILMRLAAFTAAYNKHDVAAVASIYTGKATLIAPKAKLQVGREAISEHYQRAFKSGVGRLRYRVLEINQPSADTAIELGQTEFRVGKQTISGRTMHVWKKVKGIWYLHRDMSQVLQIFK